VVSFPEREAERLEKKKMTGGVGLAGREGERVAGPFPLGCCWVIWLRAGPVGLSFPFFCSASFFYFLFPILLFELAKII
jgi:hypothetical protein